MSDWVGNGNSVYKTLGASNHTDKEREKDDYYATDPIAIDKLLTVERPNENVWECACGAGHGLPCRRIHVPGGWWRGCRRGCRRETLPVPFA